MSVWNFWSKFYDRLWVQQVSLRPTRRAVIEKLTGMLPVGARVLDVGCGIGELLGELSLALAVGKSGQTPFLLGMDGSSGMIEQARKRHSALTFEVCDVSGICSLAAAKEDRFDALLCTHSLPYYDTPDKVLRDMSEVMAPGGILILAQASSNSMYDAMALSLVKLTTGKASYYSIDSLRELAAERFDVESVERVRTSWFMPSIVMVTLRVKAFG
jgi:ubiquinone/menaquinone biosynthesis C-methylase UbiE